VSFAAVVGHERAAAQLRRAAVHDRAAGAFLLFGPTGVGKRTLADALTARLLCDAPPTDDACGRCAHCTRVASGTHPDVHVVTREQDRRDIRTDQIRELARWLALQPLMAARKVALIDGAHCLNEHGQNALLKTLEEPPGGSILLLTATSPALLLPTVRSRCQLIRLDPLPPEAVAQVLEARGIAAAKARTLAALAEGCPGRALELEATAATKGRELVLAALPQLGELAAWEISRLAQELAREPAEASLRVVLAWYRDLLQAALLGESLPLRNLDVLPAIRTAAPALGPVARLRQLEAVCDTIVALERNANRVLALETMLLVLREIERGAVMSSPWKTSA